MKNRKELLEELVTLKFPITETLDQLSKYPWDSDEIYVIVLKNHVISVLEQALNDKITVGVIEDWANAIEAREDLDFESEELQQIIVELANPTLYSELNNESVKGYLIRLEND